MSSDQIPPGLYLRTCYQDPVTGEVREREYGDDGEVWLHAGPVLADEHLVAAALADAPGLDARRNAALGVTIVHGTTAKGDRTGSHAVVDAVLDVVARAGVADLEQRLSGRAPAAPEPRSRR